MENKWINLVNNKTIRLFGKWVEQKICLGPKGAYVPQYEKRHIFSQFRDKNGNLKIKITILEGICAEKSTKPRLDWTDIDEFGICFLNLTEQQQKIILSYEDPFDEFDDVHKWNDFLHINKWTQTFYERLLTRAMVNLQELVELRGLSERMDRSKELHGWDSIAAFLKKSIPTVVKLAKECKMPVTLLGGMPYTTEKRLEEWKEKMIRNHPFWKQVNEREKK